MPAALVAEFDAMAAHYPHKRAALIPALHRCQDELGGWITPAIMEWLADYFGLEPVEVYGVASFYPMFHLKPRGRHLVGVCHNISCDLRGARDILARACEVAGCEPGGTSADGRFSVFGVECQGACTKAPMFDMDGTYYENLKPSDVEKILGQVDRS